MKEHTKPTTRQKSSLRQMWLSTSSATKEATKEANVCVSDEVLAAVLTGIATEQEQQQWELHQRFCEHCQERFLAYQTLLDGAEFQVAMPSWEQTKSRGEVLYEQATPLPADFFQRGTTPVRPFEEEGVTKVNVNNTNDGSQGQSEGLLFSSRLPKLQRWFSLPLFGLAATCAAILMVLWFEPFVFQPKGTPPSTSIYRPKGLMGTQPQVKTPRLEFRYFLKRGEQILQGQPKMYIQPNDQIRFVYWNENKQPLYVLLWSVNSKKEYTLLYPNKAESSLQLKHASPNVRNMLPGGVVLDQSTVKERFVVCVSKQPLLWKHFQGKRSASVERKAKRQCLYHTEWTFLRR